MKTEFNQTQPLLYTSGRTILLWFLMLIAILLLAVVAWLASLLPEEEMIRSFGSVTGGRFFQLGLILIGSIFIWPMLWTSGRYIVRVEKRNEVSVIIHTWTIVGVKIKTWPLEAWANSHSHYNDGEFEADDRKVDAPWRSVKPAGGKKMIIDMQGDFPYGEDALLEVLAPSGVH